MNIGLIIIATGKYKQFINQLLISARKYFMQDHNVHFFLFTDEDYYDEDVTAIIIEHEEWPGPTLHRYKNIVKSRQLFDKMDYLFYSDVDMRFVDHVGDEILQDLFAVLHPGFAMFPNTGSWCTDPYSAAYTTNKNHYYAGGFQGGRKGVYLSACKLMAQNIADDEEIGVMAPFHDESHWNCFLSKHGHSWLYPDYCMVEQPELRKMWKIDHLKPKILALNKNHKEVRS